MTVITVTITPTASTSTQYVTVSEAPPAPPPSMSCIPPTSPHRLISPVTTFTSTQIVTVTVGTPTATSTTTSGPKSTAVAACPGAIYDQCGGQGWSGCTSCDKAVGCSSVNRKYFLDEHISSKLNQVQRTTSNVSLRRRLLQSSRSHRPFIMEDGLQGLVAEN